MKERGLALTTVDRYDGLLCLHLLPTFGGKDLDEIRFKEELADLRRHSVDIDECALRVTHASPELRRLPPASTSRSGRLGTDLARGA